MKINNISIIGAYLGSDCVVRDFKNNRSVLEFSVAKTQWWVNQEGEEQTKTHWFLARKYGKKGAFEKLAPLLAKGCKVSFAGTLKIDEYADQEGLTQRKGFIEIDEVHVSPQQQS